MARIREATSTPGVYKETGPSGVSYVARWKESGRTRSRSFPRLSDARRFKAEQVANPTASQGSQAGSFAALADRYVKLHPNWRDGGATQRTRLKPLVAHFGDLPASQISTSHVRGYLADLASKGQAASTQEATRALIKAVFQVAVDDGELGRNPVAPIKAIRDPRTSEEKDARLTDQQIEQLAQHMPSDEWRRLVWFILGTGLRGGEAAGLTWEKVDFLRQRIRIDQQLKSGGYGNPVYGPPKNKNSTRWVPLRDGMAEILEEQREAHPVTVDDLVWVTSTNYPMVRSNRSEAWSASARGLDLPPAARGWHALRHTCGSRLLDSGAPVTAIAGMLGHTVDELLRTYAHAETDYTDALRDIPVTEPRHKKAH